MKTTFSIRTTLLFILSLLNMLIAVQLGYDVVEAWINHKNARSMQAMANITNKLFTAERYLSEERAASIALLFLPKEISGDLHASMAESRVEADAALSDALDAIDTPQLNENIAKIEESLRAQEVLRRNLDVYLATPVEEQAGPLADALFANSNKLIRSVHQVLEKYSLPFHHGNPAAARQMRFSNLIWGITETAGQEYTLLGRLIAENKYPTPAEEEVLLMLRGRIQFGWELAESAAVTNAWGEQIQPAMEEASTHYFMTFEQIKEIFQPLQISGTSAVYPVSAEMWLGLAGQATASLYALNKEMLSLGDAHLQTIERQARQAIMFRLLMFFGALLLSVYSWRL
ncbi:MAG: hypothetical protein KJ667_04580, partial [Alphaproteobacteria bacterium]|nr:hypothetical protein [Alphaproteobacteria bacterium]